MQTPRSMHRAIAVGTDLYVLGGSPPHSGGTFSSVEVFDTLLLTWAPAPDMLVPREQFGVAELGGLVYVMGGQDFGPLDDVEIFDPATGTWTFRMPLPLRGSAVTAEAFGGSVYAFGLFYEPNGTAQVFVYDPLADTWSRGPTPPEANRFGGSAVIGAEILVSTWLSRGGGARGLLAFDPGTGQWTKRANKHSRAREVGVAAEGGLLYFVGGIGP